MSIGLFDNRLASIYQLSKRAYSQYKPQILLLVVLGFIAGVLEGVGINALIPLISFVFGDGQGGTDFISRAIERLFTSIGVDFSVEFLLIFIAFLFILKAVVSVLVDYVRIKVTARYEEETRNRLFQSALTSSWPHLLKQKLGHLETILLVDANASAKLFNQIASAITVVTSLLIYVLVALNIDLIITLIALAMGGVLFLIFKPILFRIKQVAYERTALNKNTAHHVSENIFGVKITKTMTAVDQVIDKGRQFFARFRELYVRAGVFKSLVTSFVQPIGVVFILILFGVMYRSPEFAVSGAALIGELAAIAYLVERIFIYIQQLQRSLNSMNDMVPHLRSVLDYESAAADNLEEAGGEKLFKFERDLRFEEVGFTYENNSQAVFSGLSFTVNKGKMVGLIGPSGAGKTTIVDLILRLLRPVEGKILLDDIDIQEIDLANWRQNIGYVSQDMFLINDTVANNIRFYDQSISDKDIIESLRSANAYEFVKELPAGVDTVIGERGIRLSVGQRQRIAIARVLAREPELLVLDEATSALDNESEVKIQEAIHKLKGDVTVIAIAHRLSTVMDTDRLLVVENGRITEEGDPQDLLRDKESYFSKTYHLR